MDSTTSAEPVTVTPPTLPVPPPPASPRLDVQVNTSIVANAFRSGVRSRSVRLVQHVLTTRGFTPGNTDGFVDHGTRAAYAKFQQSIDERPTGVPTADSLDVLGFDVTG